MSRSKGGSDISAVAAPRPRGPSRWGRAAHAILVVLALLVPAGAANAQASAPQAIRIPPWFVDTFLDFRDDAAAAAKEGRRVLVYFGQDGCPYCRLLMETTFAETRIAEKARRGFLPIALNLWGDREITWFDGRRMTEKELGRALKVQFTPTLLFLDEQARPIARMNGYFPAARLEAALDWAAGKLEKRVPFAEHLQAVAGEPASPTLHGEPFYLKPPLDLRAALAAGAGRPLVAIVERPNCASCDELHREGLRRPEVAALLPKLLVAQVDTSRANAMIAPDGTATDTRAWARRLGLPYAPGLVFFDAAGAEVFRVEAYLRPFHLASALDYVASGAYRGEPSFQRFIQARAERMRVQGRSVDLWK